MQMEFINVLLGIISFILTTMIGLYINAIYQKRKDYKNFLERLKNIVGLGGKIMYTFDGETQPFQVDKIDKQGVVLVNKKITIFIPTSKLINEDIIVPTVDYDELTKDGIEQNAAKKQELDEFSNKRIAEIYAHSYKDMFKTHILPELVKLFNSTK